MNSLWLVHDTITSVKERLASCLHVWCLVVWMLLLPLRYCTVAEIEMSCGYASILK